MKKIYMLLTGLIVAHGLSAQTVIDNNDLPLAGDAFAVAYDTIPGITITPASGSAQTWNYTTLQMHDRDTFAYFNPALTPQGAAFPTSDMSSYDRNSGTYSYFKHRAAGLFIQGISLDLTAAGFGVLNMMATPEEKFVQNPTTYGTNYNVNSVYQIAFNKRPGDPDTTFKHFVKRVVTADAFGSITTNFGTYDAIRVHSNEITTDSVFITFFGATLVAQEVSPLDTINRYTFLIDTIGHPIAIVTADAANNIRDVEFLTSNSFPPTALFYADSTSVDVAEIVKFNNYSAGSTSWLWNFGDGTATSALHSPTHSYSAPGVYTVTLIAYNATSSDTLEIIEYIIVGGAMADFLVDNANPTEGQQVNFTNNSENSTTWEWDFGDGTTSTLPNPSHVYTAAGAYTVSLIASNSFSSDTMIQYDYINVSVATGIAETNITNMVLYPNPAKDMISFVFNNDLIRSIEVYDVTGKLVSEIQASDKTASLNTSSLSEGLYFYKIIEGAGKTISTGKFSVVK